jgi:hypothetical protein
VEHRFNEEVGTHGEATDAGVKGRALRDALAAVLGLVFCAAVAAQGGEPTLRIRGAIDKVDATSMVVRDRAGKVTPLAYADDLTVSEVVPIDPAAIQAGAFIGTAAVPRADGTLAAIEVHVFPEEARGRGEGHRPFDLQPGSTMTNATVASVTPGPNDRVVTLRYKDGEKTIHVPNGVPIVTMKAADKSLLVPGAKVIVSEQLRGGKNVATRVIVGRNGFEPPM